MIISDSIIIKCTMLYIVPKRKELDMHQPHEPFPQNLCPSFLCRGQAYLLAPFP